MDKQTTIAFVLIGIILVVWLYMTAPEPVVDNTKQSDSTTVIIDTIESVDKDKPIINDVEIQPNILEKDTSPDREEDITTIENKVFIVELSNKGGNIHKICLIQPNRFS